MSEENLNNAAAASDLFGSVVSGDSPKTRHSPLSPKQRKVLAMLRDKPSCTLQEAVTEIGTDIYANACKHVGVTLANMVKRGMLIRVKAGVFSLPNVSDQIREE